MQLVPEVAARLRVHARGGLVEQQQLRVVQQACGQREPLLPATGQRARELVCTGHQSDVGQRLLNASAAILHAVHARDEVEVLANREIFPERKPLRHVTDFAFDRLGLANDVVAEAGTFTAIRCQQPAQDANRCRLSAAVRAKETKDFATPHC